MWIAAVLLIVLFAGYLSRAIVVPVRRVARAAGLAAGGDLAVRLDERGARELAGSFNTMTVALSEHRDELEGQDVELEAQSAELETQREAIDSERRRWAVH